jgi:hypothetical protein
MMKTDRGAAVTRFGPYGERLAPTMGCRVSCAATTYASPPRALSRRPRPVGRFLQRSDPGAAPRAKQNLHALAGRKAHVVGLHNGHMAPIFQGNNDL